MRPLPVTAYVLAGGVALAVFTGWQGYRAGEAACEAAHAHEAEQARKAGAELTAARQIAERKVYALSRQLEDQAYADPVAIDRCLSPSRVRRFNTLR